MKDQSREKDERGLIRVIKFSSAIGLGIMASILYSVKQVSPELRYQISWGSGWAFAVAVGLSWAFWRVVFGKSHDLNPGMSRARKRWLAVLSLVLAAATLLPFAAAFKDVASEKAREVAQGTALAVLALAGVGTLFWRVTRFLNADTERNAGEGEKPMRPRE